MSLLNVLFTVYLCAAGLFFLLAAGVTKEPQQGTRYGVISIAIFAYAALRVLMYLFLWMEAL